MVCLHARSLLGLSRDRRAEPRIRSNAAQVANTACQPEVNVGLYSMIDVLFVTFLCSLRFFHFYLFLFAAFARTPSKNTSFVFLIFYYIIMTFEHPTRTRR